MLFLSSMPRRTFTLIIVFFLAFGSFMVVKAARDGGFSLSTEQVLAKRKAAQKKGKKKVDDPNEGITVTDRPCGGTCKNGKCPPGKLSSPCKTITYTCRTGYTCDADGNGNILGHLCKKSKSKTVKYIMPESDQTHGCGTDGNGAPCYRCPKGYILAIP